MAYFNQYYNQANPNMSQQPAIDTSKLQQPNGLPNKMGAPSGLDVSNPSANQGGGGGGMGNTVGQIGNYANAANIGIQSFNSSQQATEDYTIDGYAGIKGAASGLSGGGWLGAVTGGIGGYLGNYSQVNKNLKKLDTSVDGMATDQEGNVRYQGREFMQADDNIAALQKGIKSSDGNMDNFNEVAGTVLGPGAGPLLDTIFGTNKKQWKKKYQLEYSRDMAERNFNAASQDATNRRLSKEQYLQQTNNYNKLYNLYNR